MLNGLGITVITSFVVLESSHWWADSAWWLVIIAGVTGIFIGWQAWETRKAANSAQDTAKAALTQAEYLAASERAWMVVRIEGESIPPVTRESILYDKSDMSPVRTGFEARMTNRGKTPAYLIESGHQGVIMPHNESLPAIAGPYEDRGVEKGILKWEGDGLPLQPNADILKSFLGTWCKDAGKLQSGSDVLWVYGYVIYRDAFKQQRETYYCVRWNSGVGTNHGPSWDIGGPTAYNRAT